MKKFLFVLLFFAGISFAQDPGTVIEIYLTNNGREISNSEIIEYNVYMSGRSDRFEIQNNEYPKELPQFRYFAWTPYYGNVYNFEIIHDMDTMTVLFQMNLDTIIKSDHNSKEKYLWNAAFLLNIPFKAGYFEVTDFVKKDSFYYTISESHKWENITVDNRVLEQKK